MNEASINEAIADTTVWIYVLKQHASDEPDEVGVVLKGIKGLVKKKKKKKICHHHVVPNP